VRLKPWFAAAAAAIVGLWASGPASQIHAAGATTAVSTIVPTDLPTTWRILMRELESGDFTINATIRESATIRVLLQTKIPSTWVDCGSVTVNSRHPVFGNRSYNFLAANSVRYMVADEALDELVDVERRTSLNALATIRLKPVRGGTQISVDAQYVMKFKTREFGKKITARRFQESVDFDSASSSQFHEEIREGAAMKPMDIACRPTGELERRIAAVVATPQG